MLKYILIAVIGFLILFAVIYGIAVYAARKPVEVATAILNHIQAGDAQAVHALSYPHEDLSLENIVSFVEKISPVLTGTPTVKYRSVSTDTNGTIAEIHFNHPRSDGGTAIILTKLIKDQQGDWKLLNIDVK